MNLFLPLILLAAAPVLHAETLLFASMGNTSPEEHSALTAYCNGNPKTDRVLECRIQQQTIRTGASKAEIERKKAQILVTMDQVRDKDVKSLDELCAKRLDMSPEQQQEVAQDRLLSQYMRELQRACRAPDRISAFKAMSLKAAGNEATNCLVLPTKEWTARFVRREDNVFKTDPAEGGMCGGVTIETLHKTDNTDFWA